MTADSVTRNNYSAIYCIALAMAIPWQSINWFQKAVTPFHVFNALLVTVMVLPFLTRKAVHFYFIAPLFVYQLGTVLGMFSSNFLLYNLYTIGQDLYLYIWFVLLSVILTNKRNVKYMVIAWLVAAVLVISMTEGRKLLTDIGTSRLEFSFRNPNRAAAYFLLSAFLCAHPSVPLMARIVLTVVFVRAVMATGSAGGLLAFAVGAAIMIVVWFHIKYGARLRLQAITLMGLLGACLVGSLALSGDALREVYADMTGQAGTRVERSADVREKIWGTGIEAFKEHPLGIGPGSFFQQVPTRLSKGEKNVELHSDWFATLVERGVFGVLGLVGFILAIGIKIWRMIGFATRSQDREYTLWSASLAGAVSSYLIMSMTHEVLHHETFWLLLATLMGCLGVLEEEVREESPYKRVGRFAPTLA